jgi:acetoin utilization transport system ATP-binding protein
MIDVKNLRHQFKIGKKGQEKIVPVLEDISFGVREGEIVSILGRSGSGKSTLLNLIAGYIRPTNGSIFISGQDVTNLSESKWAQFRMENLGFIFQSFQLIPSMNAYQNVELPLTLKGIAESERAKIVLETFERVGMMGHEQFFPSELSGGQQQRIGIARAMALKPKLILADEPTGSLDHETEKEVLAFIRKLNEEEGTTFLMITHDSEVAAFADRSVSIVEGRLQS